ncbi:protein of unknown function DUF917 [Thermoanaerobacter mathranii subsp. mathranii str. A3]|uniref:DUF917 domain-containing protein n=4 Tax=Thermoanaerobacter TaxID=1754 RepID=B0K7W6_THEP3|nr:MULTISPECIES: DUF917 domain-containing protein [Thermoanaerobacter]ABY95786.1 protein of unknown function DUF917 [Thermoanaerobacter pseudethanolicus ATCC 33223]ADD01399.1 protein of unknown function DUF917 [Thermoanaerobacter italicus Ab9]ADH59914.1 protein of unknown function DUF917 [Thermoanaerobacter mathranii subsp. mathranii str. A3]ADV80716.1 protein of unknown function DUF917 [Thermoanaerobacter brockii subsp. finnii Ako-1]HBW59175.1 DUF917 domain-containing protein [Thermoanaerobac
MKKDIEKLEKIDLQAVEDIAVGAALLGTGGGGDPYVGKLMAIQSIQRNGPVELIDVENIPDDALVVPVAMMGAPTVLVEKVPSGKEIFKAFDSLQSFLGKEVYAVLPIEAGGVNSMIPIMVAGERKVPLVDVDGMGRAFPELQMVTYHLYGVSATPMVLADEKGNSILLHTINNFWTESLARNATVVMGGSVMIAIYPMSGKDVKQAGIRNVVSYSAQIGKAIREARKKGENPIEALLEVTGGYMLFKGKISDVQRRTTGGFVRGEAHIDGIDQYKGEAMIIDFQNENLIARRNGKVVATVPDLICTVDAHTALPITTEGLRYGQRVFIIGIPCDEKWRTEKGIETVGPRYFGYDVDYIPVEELNRG